MLSATDAVAQLADPASPKRRAAAKRLRHLADPSAGPALLAAVEAEVSDPRTWETQYQMVMALASCGYTPARPWLIQLAASLDKPSMLAVGVGHAVVQLGDVDESVDWSLRSGNGSLVDGALRGVAMTRSVPRPQVVEEVLAFLQPLDAEDGLRFWAAVAAVDWRGESVRAALDSWASLPRTDVAEAARASRTGRHVKHSIL